MNWRSPRFRLSLVVVVMLIVGLGLAFIIRNVTSSPITTVWQASSPSFTQQEQQDIQSAWEKALLAPNQNNISGHEFTIVNAQRHGDWAIFSATERVNPTTTLIPEPLFFLAHFQGATWTVWIPSSPDFCEELKQVPDTLLKATDKAYFC